MAKIHKYLALLLCLVMLVGMMPVQALATGDTGDDGNAVSDTQPQAEDTEEETTESLAEETTETSVEETTEATSEEAEDAEDAEETEEEQPLAEPAATEADAVKVVDPEGTETYYASLQQALAGAFGGGNRTYAGGNWVITLLADTEYASQNIQYPIDEVSVNLTIDLNGHTIQGVSTTAVLNINFGNKTPGTLTIQDSAGGGTITGGKQGIVFLGASSTLNFNGGTITNNHGGSTGGGICCTSTTNQAVINLNGGMITGNSVTGTSSANTGLGGGVYACQINLNGTIITGNAAYSGSGSNTGRGGGIAVPINGTAAYNVVNINTNTVYGNTASSAGDDLMIAKNGMTNHSLSIGTENWYIDGWNGTSGTVASKGQTDRYSAEAPVAYTTGGFSAIASVNVGLKYVAPSVTTYTVTYTDGVEDAVIFEDQTHTVEEGDPTPDFEGTIIRKGYVFDGWDPEVAETVTADVTYTARYIECTHSWDDGVLDEESHANVYTCSVCGETRSEPMVARLESTGEYYATLQEAVTAANAYSMTLTEDHDQTITLVGNTTECVKITYSPNSKNLYDYNLTIDLNGHTVTGDSTGSVFTITRYTSNSRTLTVIFNDSVGTGMVTGGNTTGNGGAIYVSGKSSYLVINGGTWTGNHADKNGGVISSSQQTGTYVTINGGLFTGNTAGVNGGAFYIRNLTMTGGTVTGNAAVSGGGLYSFSGYSQILNMTGGAIYGNTATTDGDDIIWRANAGLTSTAYLTLVDASKMGVAGALGWYVDDEAARADATAAVEFEDYALYNTLKTRIALKVVMESAPEAPDQWGANVMEGLVKTVCDTDDTHESVISNWSAVNCQVFPTTSEPVWDAELATWTIGIRIQNLTVQYVARLENANKDIRHELVGESLVLATLKWDRDQQLWVTLDGEPLVVHATCDTKPAAPTFGQLSSYQIQVYGQVGFENKLYAIYLNSGSVTVGEVQGNRQDGFTVDVTVAITEDDTYQSGWLAQRAPELTVADYTYDWAKTPATITFTLTYTGDLDGTLYGNRHYSGHYDWVLASNGKHFGKVGEAYLMPSEPDAPVQSNVTDALVTVICDSDPDRHESVSCKWYSTCCKAVSGIVWIDELNAWIVDVKIGSLYIMYVDQLEDANNGTIHELVDDITGVYATLVWDVTAQQWIPTEPIELHTTCRTVPLAPVYSQLESYQIKVHGDVNGDGVYGGTGETWTTSIPENSYTLSEVYGSREDGFYVDVTVNFADGDIYQTRWIEKCDATHFYKYDWEKTEKTVTFTLRYNGSLTGTLYGNRHAANTNYDWVLDTTGKTWGVVSEAYIEKTMCTVQVVIYRNGDTTTPYATVSLDKIAKGDTLDLTGLDIHDYYTCTKGFDFYGWFNDGRWNQYKAGQAVSGMDEIYINGWTNIICMVYDYQTVVVKAVTNADKDNAEVIYTGYAPMGDNLVEWLNANVEVAEKTGYTLDKWYNWDWYGHKYEDSRTVNGWTNVYVTYTANTYTVSFNTNGGEEVDDRTVTFGNKYGTLPSPTITGLSTRKTDWYLVDKEGNVTEINIRNTTLVSEARDHTLFLMRDVLAPTLTVKLAVPGGLSDDYKYYIPENSTRVLTVTVDNRNDDILDYSYQWYKDGEPIDGATEATLTLDGNVSDSGTYTVMVTASLKADSTIVTGTSSACAEKSQKVQIMYAANTLCLNTNYGETPDVDVTYWGSGMATIRTSAERTGYTFLGWNTDADGNGTTYQVGETVAFTGENGNGGIVLELYAQWEANTYTVTLDANGGKVDPETITATYGEAMSDLPVPTRAGYTFNGWVDAQGNAVTAETIYTATSDSTLTAKWTVNATEPSEDTSPKTGDGMILYVWISMLSSAAAVLYLVDRQRKTR